MRFIHLQKLVTYVLAGLGLLSLSFGHEVALPSLVLLFLAFFATLFVEGSLVSRPWWSKGTTVLLVLLLAIFILRGFGGDAGWLGLAMEFSGWLSISRLANRRTAADYQQVAMLAFIQLIAATVLTTDLSYAGLFVAFVVVTPWVLTFAHLRAEIERNYPPQPSAGGGADLLRVLRSKRIVGPSFLLWTSFLSVPMLLFTVALFAIFPRVGLGFVSFGNQRGQDAVGFGNDVELGGFGLIRDDPTVVLRVNPGRRLSFAEEHRVLRLRGTAFDHYDGRRWTRSDDEAVSMASVRGYYALRRMASPSDLELQIVLERLNETVVFLPTGTVGLSIGRRGTLGIARERVHLRRGHGLDIRYESSDELGLIYNAIVSLKGREADVPVARDMDDDRYLQLPDGHERVFALARELTRDVDDPLEAARILESHLRDEGHYRYSLNQPDTGSKPPLEVFLFEARRGHCEYFATALAVMLRGAGIPARNVTGFVGGHYNGYGGYYAVRQSDAHSWVEALIPGRGWVTLDPTPPAHVDAHPADYAMNELRSILDAVRAYWMLRVVGYDLRTQLRAVRAMREFWRQLPFDDLSFGDHGSDRGEDKRSFGDGLAALGGWLVALAILAVIGVLVFRRLLKRGERQTLSESARRARRLYLELERILARRGHARPAHVTPEAHARRLAEGGFPASDVVVQVTQAYIDARYGARGLSEEDARQLRGRLDTLKRAA